MLRVAILFLLPSLIAGNLEADKTAAFCAMNCLPKTPYPPVAEKHCIRLVQNSTAAQGSGLWSYDRLVFEGPDCGVYTFVVRSESKITMTPSLQEARTFEKDEWKDVSAANTTCLRGCGRGLLDDTCTNPQYLVSRGYLDLMPKTKDQETTGTTVYRAVQFGCRPKITTIARAYRSEFEMRAVLEGNEMGGNAYSEVWSINRGFLQTVPDHLNVVNYAKPNTETPVEEVADKNVCGLECFGYTEPSSSTNQRCNRVLVNDTVSDKNGKWSYAREIYEGPKCNSGYTYLITTKSNVIIYNEQVNGTLVVERDGRSLKDTASCLRTCGFSVCDAPLLSYRHTILDFEIDGGTLLYNQGRFECNGVKTVIARVFRDETMIRIDLEREESPQKYSEKWHITEGQLVTETMPTPP